MSDAVQLMRVDCAVCGEAEEHSNHRLRHHFQRGTPYPSPPEVQELFASLPAVVQARALQVMHAMVVMLACGCAQLPYFAGEGVP